MSAESDAEHQKMAAAHADAMAAQRLTGQLEQQAAARAELAADLAALRRAGVKTFRGQGIDVEFFSADVPQPKEESRMKYLPNTKLSRTKRGRIDGDPIGGEAPGD